MSVLRDDIVLTLHLDPNRDKAIKVILPEELVLEGKINQVLYLEQ